MGGEGQRTPRPGPLPEGTVAFVVCSPVAPPALWDDEAEAVADAVKVLHELFVEAVTTRNGVCAGTTPHDGMSIAAFPRASDAVLAARDVQRAALAAQWPTSSPVQARLAVTTGEATMSTAGRYAGLTIARAAQLCELAHGGQVLVSATAREVAIDRLPDPITLVDVGRHRLRDLTRPERIFQVADPSLPGEFPPPRSLDVHPNNLPIQLTSFIGRGDEIARVGTLLLDNRLVTIGGVGGAGKTRLAQHVGAGLIDAYPDGVWWIELADRREAESLATTVAIAMGIHVSAGEQPEVEVAERLTNRELLLIFDNCEHVIEPAARLTAEILQRAPHVDMLATSREPLGVPGEVIWQIPQLAMPNEPTGDPAELIAFEAVELFVDRAQRVRPNFRLRTDNAEAIASIVRRLDGIPLALELAASRCRSLTPPQILSGLSDSLDLLTSTGRSRPARHQTLAASMWWSYELLSAAEQVLLRRLAVFSGGCTLTDAEEVVVDDELPRGSVLDALDGLVAQSLVQLDDNHLDGRYRLLETVRQFGGERLAEHGEHERFATRHADHFLTVCREVGPGLDDGRALEAFARLTPEFNNLRAALSTLGAAGRWGDAVSIVYDTTIAWFVLASPEADDHLTKALEHQDDMDPRSRARAWVARSLMRTNSGDYAGAFADAQAAAAQDDDLVASARAAVALGAAMGVVDVAAGDALLEELIASMGPEASLLDQGAARWGRATFQLCWGDAKLGNRLAEELSGQTGYLSPASKAFVWSGLAWGACLQGRFTEAFDLIDEADANLAALASTIGIEPDQLVWSGSAQLETARALAREATEAIPDRLDRVKRLSRVGKAERSILMHVLLGTVEARHQHMTGDPAGALSAFDTLIDAALSVGVSYFASIALASAAECARQVGDDERAEAHVSRLDALGAPYRTLYAWIRGRLTRARIAAANGDNSAAETLTLEALTDAYDSLYRPDVAVGLGVLSHLAGRNERYVEAARLAGAAQRLRDDIGLVCDFERVHDDVEDGLAAARRARGDAEIQAAFDEGYELDLDATVAAIFTRSATRQERDRSP